MRRLLLLILMCWPFLFAGTICNVVVGGVAAPAAECTTALWTNSGTGTTDLDINDDANLTYVGQVIQDTVSHTICKVEVWVSYKAGDISGKTFRAYFAPMNVNALTLASAVEATNTVTGSNSWDPSTNSTGTKVTFNFAGYTLTANTKYAFYITCDGAADASNYAELEISADANVPGGTQQSWKSDGSLQAGSGNDIKAIYYTE